MIINARLTKSLHEEMMADLERPHKFAYERVGFVGAKLGTATENQLLLFTSYNPVPDEEYIQDRAVGAKVGSGAIRAAMQRVLDAEEGVFHVHLHPFRGQPRLSTTDEKGILPLIPSFVAVGWELPHGILLLGLDNAICYVRLPGEEKLTQVKKISIVGYPSKSYV